MKHPLRKTMILNMKKFLTYYFGKKKISRYTNSFLGMQYIAKSI